MKDLRHTIHDHCVGIPQREVYPDFIGISSMKTIPGIDTKCSVFRG